MADQKKPKEPNTKKPETTRTVQESVEPDKIFNPIKNKKKNTK